MQSNSIEDGKACGIRIKSFEEKDGGKWKCITSLQGSKRMIRKTIELGIVPGSSTTGTTVTSIVPSTTRSTVTSNVPSGFPLPLIQMYKNCFI